MPHLAYLGLGANLGDPEAQLRAVMGALRAIPNTTLLRSSSLYASAPVDAPGQADYVNAVALLETSLAPLDLLGLLRELETDHGRVRSVRNAPRTLDLDLLLYDEDTLSLPELTIPHPRMHLRRFVLEPLLEIAPGICIPGHGPATLLLAATGNQAVRRLPAT